jgi:hypothetical protein
MLKVYIQTHEFNSINVWICDDDYEKGKLTVAKPVKLEFVKRPENAAVEPTLKFDRNTGHSFLSELAEALINAGYRDKAISKTDEIKRIENHLEDMRQLVFKDEVNKKA